MMNNLESVPREVIKSAINIVKNQINTPQSPCKKNQDGKVNFCAAAALAVAGLELKGLDQRRQTFVSELIDSGSSEPIRNIFREFGWSVEACNKAVVINDTFPDVVRTKSVVQFFESALH